MGLHRAVRFAACAAAVLAYSLDGARAEDLVVSAKVDNTTVDLWTLNRGQPPIIALRKKIEVRHVHAFCEPQ